MAYFVFFGSWLVGHTVVVIQRPKGDLYRGLSLGMIGGSFNGMVCSQTPIRDAHSCCHLLTGVA